MNTKMKIAIAAITCAGITTAAIAHKGHGNGPRAERMFERMDTDNDGRVTTDDAKAFAAARFARMDTNADGTVTRDERRAMRQNRRAERFARMDTDGDGKISQADMQAAATARAARRFARLDKDGDGFVSLAEIEQMRGERRGHGKHRMGGMRGPVTLEKMEVRVLKRFSRLDTDGDGILTIEEVRNR